MLLDILAVVARKDYEDRRRRQAQGIAKAKAEGAYKGRPVDEALHRKIGELLDAGFSWSKVTEHTGASRSTILRVVNARKGSSVIA
jgi:DNA invertase Pin-like site-specific DNA recombinase